MSARTPAYLDDVLRAVGKGLEKKETSKERKPAAVPVAEDVPGHSDCRAICRDQSFPH